MAKNDVATGLRAIGVGSTKKVDTSKKAYRNESIDKMSNGEAQDKNYKDWVKSKSQPSK